MLVLNNVFMYLLSVVISEVRAFLPINQMAQKYIETRLFILLKNTFPRLKPFSSKALHKIRSVFYVDRVSPIDLNSFKIKYRLNLKTKI